VNNIKLAIHHRPGSFSTIWVDYCNKNNIPYKLVNCYSSDIVSQLSDCDGLMWHWDLTDYRPALLAKQLTISLEKKGLKVFPDFNTSWHYDDKVGQKYLLEAINVPFINTYVFYSLPEAIEWADITTFPKVFKLRGGAGSSNVKLVNNKKEAKLLIKKAFSNGFSYTNPVSRLKERFWMLKRDKNLLAIKKTITGFARLVFRKEKEKFAPKQIGYVYFQEFVPNNDSDIRLVVVGHRCFGMIRYCRENDFRASGSGLVDYNNELINTEAVRIAFHTAEKLKTQSVALDFIKDKDGYKIIEMSYAFISELFPGYWDTNLVWHPGEAVPQKFMAEDFINSLYNIGARTY
jgi:hypothetical protein